MLFHFDVFLAMLLLSPATLIQSVTANHPKSDLNWEFTAFEHSSGGEATSCAGGGTNVTGHANLCINYSWSHTATAILSVRRIDSNRRCKRGSYGFDYSFII